MERQTSGEDALGRRQLLARAGAVAVGGVAAGLAGPAGEAVAAEAVPSAAPAFTPVTVRPGDRRYDSLLRGNNFRFVGHPDEIRVCGSTEQVVRAVQDAVRSGRRIAARSGGHCFENFTGDPAVRTLLDLSPMDEVGYDARHRAFSVQPGATLGHVYRTLFKGWGVTIPAGGCPEVGAGGHFAGGGYGPLSRRYGSVVDHLHGVEVVVVDRDGTARAVVATRDSDGPHRDLWWAHTGGGGGNFGVVTRYFLRSPGASGDDPSRLLPPSPRRMLRTVVSWAWDDRMTEKSFTAIVRNFGAWHERNSAPGSPGTGLYPILLLPHRSARVFYLVVQMDADLPGGDRLLTDFLSAVTEGTGVEPAGTTRRTTSWLHATTWPGSGEPGGIDDRRYKPKAAYLRRPYTDRQLAALHRHLTDSPPRPNAVVLLIGYGGQVNAVRPDATAVAQRDSIMKAVFQTIWDDESDDDANIAWIRAFYRDVYADTGGVPLPDDAVSDGSYINYPDRDLADPQWNTSGVPWHALYYKGNYPRLQRVKARWDPRDVFRHAMSIEPPS
ncbi:FAD-linked oxidase [Streptomyces griseocarneus]|nr:FAD-linked oxidase [Streptomyces griseocarneus]